MTYSNRALFIALVILAVIVLLTLTQHGVGDPSFAYIKGP